MAHIISGQPPGAGRRRERNGERRPRGEESAFERRFRAFTDADEVSCFPAIPRCVIELVEDILFDRDRSRQGDDRVFEIVNRARARGPLVRGDKSNPFAGQLAPIAEESKMLEKIIPVLLVGDRERFRGLAPEQIRHQNFLRRNANADFDLLFRNRNLDRTLRHRMGAESLYPQEQTEDRDGPPHR